MVSTHVSIRVFISICALVKALRAGKKDWIVKTSAGYGSGGTVAAEDERPETAVQQ